MTSGSIVELRKRNKYNRILNTIRKQPGVSRADIKRLTRYSTNTVLSGVENLIQEGFVVEQGFGKSAGGRPPTLLSINTNGGIFIGLEFYAENITCTAINLIGEQVYNNRTALNRRLNAQAIMEALFLEIDTCIVSIGSSGRLLGIGIGVPGQLDKARGFSILYDHIESWHDIPVKDVITQKYQLPVYVENNVYVMTLVHKWLDTKIDSQDFLFYCIRSGIAMAAVLNGQVYRGTNSLAGEIEHFPLLHCHRACSCGNQGCLVTEVSNDALVLKLTERLRESNTTAAAVRKSPVNIHDFIDCVHKNNPESLVVLQEAAESLGYALACSISILSPGRIYLWGDLSGVGDLFLKMVQKSIDRFSSKRTDFKVPVLFSPWGTNLGSLGAAILVWQNEFTFFEKQS